MNKTITKLGILLLLLTVSISSVQALVTDPADYVVYDTGMLGDSATAQAFVFPSFFFPSEGTIITKIGALGRGASSNADARPYGVPFKDGDGNTSVIWGIKIQGRQEVTFPTGVTATLTHTDPGITLTTYASIYSLKAAEALNNFKNDVLKPGWTKIETTGRYFGYATDSLVIRIPKTCDSVYIHGGMSSSYGVYVYEVGERLNKYLQRPHGWYYAYNNGYPMEVGFRPKHLGDGDSTDIVILGTHKDFFADNKDNNRQDWTGTTTNGKLIFTGETVTNEDGTVRDRYIRGERFGMFPGFNINRIKIFGKIEKGEIPAFEGTLAAWKFMYHPKESGTPNLESKVESGGGFETESYLKYAAEEGVVRAVLSSSSTEGMFLGSENEDQFVISMDGTTALVDTAAFKDGNLHSNYYQMSFPTTGFQDLVLDFDFAVRDPEDEAVLTIAYLPQDSTNWKVLTSITQTVEPWSEMQHVSLPMTGLNNLSNVEVRLIAGNTMNASSDFLLSNISIAAYDDYDAVGNQPVKLAYINNAIDRMHTLKRATTTDSSDVVLPMLMNDTTYDVSIITKAEWADITAENISERFAQYDIVLLSSFIDPASSIASAAKALVGSKPVLNMNADLYKTWNWATSTGNVADTSFLFDSKCYVHPILSNISRSSETSSTEILFDTIVGAGNLNGFTTATYTGPAEGFLIASPLNTGTLTILHELNAKPEAKYVFLGINNENFNNMNDTGKKLLPAIFSYLKNKSVFVAPNFNMVSDGAVVANIEEMKAALQYDYSSIGLSSINIKMKANTYSFAEAFTLSPAITGIKFTPHESGEVIVTGTFTADKALKLTDLTFEKLIFNSSEIPAVINLRANDTISGTLTVNNCQFIDLKDESILMVPASAEKAYVKAFSMQNSTIRNFSGAALLSLEEGLYAFDNISMKENTFENYAGKELVLSERFGTLHADSSISVTISNNAFYDYNIAEGTKFVKLSNDLKAKVNISIDNNLFYGSTATGNALIDVYEPTFVDSTKTFTISAVGNFFEPASLAFALATEISNAEVSVSSLTKASLQLDKIFLDEAAKTISMGSPLYSAGKDFTYVGLKSNYVSRTQPETRIVNNVQELKIVLGTAIGGDVIELNNCNDTIDVYLIGSGGFSYPTDGGSLTIKAAEGQTPKLFGRLSPNNAARLDSLTYSGLIFVDSTSFSGYATDTYSPFILNTKDSINVLTIKDCGFYDFNNQYALRAQNCEGLFVGKLSFIGNYFKNMGGSNPIDGKTIGAHFMQFQAGTAYALDNIEFRNNIVSEFHGSQFFNMPHDKPTSADSIIRITIENNLFYRIGGHTPANRNFLEFNKKPVGYDVEININKNIFYERISDQYYPTCYLALFEKDEDQVVNINVLDNFFYGDYYLENMENLGPNPVAAYGEDNNLPKQGGESIDVNYSEPITRATLSIDEVFYDLSNFSIQKTSPLYTAAKGSYIGPDYIYIGELGVKEVMAAKQNNYYAKDGQLFINMEEQSAVRIYNVLGKEIYSGQLERGMNTISGLANGQLYLIKTGNTTVKVVL